MRFRTIVMNAIHLLATANVISTLATTPSFAITSEHPSRAQLYGHIQPNGTLAAGEKGISSVLHPATGFYCILPSSSTLQKAAQLGTLGPQITTDYASPNTLAWEVIMDPSSTNFSCPSTTYIEIATGDPQGNSADEDFIILFD